MEPLTVFKDGAEKVVTLAMVKLAIHSRLGISNSRFKPLAWTLSTFDKLLMLVENLVNRLLLFRFMSVSDWTLMPSMVSMKVSAITTLLALVIPGVPKLSSGSKVRVAQSIDPTSLSLEKLRVDRAVKFLSVKLPPMVSRDVLEKSLSRALLSTIRSPPISVRSPLRSID